MRGRLIERNSPRVLSAAGVVMICMMLAGVARAQQWTTNGNNIYNGNSGNAGAGPGPWLTGASATNNGAGVQDGRSTTLTLDGGWTAR